MQINQYPNEAFTINDEDFYDVDWWNGTAWESRKISGLTLKTLFASVVATIYSNNGTLAGPRQISMAGNTLTFDGGTSDAVIELLSPNSAAINFRNGTGQKRWAILKDTDGTGSNFVLQRFDPTGSFLENVVQINSSTGAVTFGEVYTFPVVDGTAGQILTTDGSGNLSWQSAPTPVPPAWGSITGTLSSQTDLQTALNGKFNNPTGTTAQYIDGTGALQTFPAFLESDALISEVYNNSGATLVKGTIVYINGGQGNLPTVIKAQADSDTNSAQTFGWVRDDISNMSNGFVIVAGKLDNLNTNGLGNGTQLYLSPTTAGNYVTTKPSAPDHLVYVGIVVRDHPTQGVIEVKIQNGYELDELHDVQISGLTDGQILVWDSGSNTWKNQNPSGPSTITELDPVINLLNTPPATPTDGDRYRVGTTPTGAWVGKNNQIAQWDATGSVWIYTIPVTDNTVYQTTTATTFRYNGTAWVQWAGTPLLQNGNTLGSTVSIGTRDNFDVRVIRGNLEKARFGTTSLQYRNGIFTSGVLDFSGISATFPALFATRNYAFQNKSGTIAHLDDITTAINNAEFIPKIGGSNVARFYLWANGLTTLFYSGLGVGGANGTQTALSVTGATVAKVIRTRFTSTTSSGSIAGYRGGSLDFFVGMGFYCSFVFGFADGTFNTSAHNWVGLGNSTTFQIGSLTYASGLGNIIGVGSDPTDATLQILHNDSAGAATKIALGADFPSNRTAGTAFTGMFCLELYNELNNTSQIKWRMTRIDLGTVQTGTITTNLPNATTGLCPVISRCNGTSTSIAAIMDVGNFIGYTVF